MVIGVRKKWSKREEAGRNSMIMCPGKKPLKDFHSQVGYTKH